MIEVDTMRAREPDAERARHRARRRLRHRRDSDVPADSSTPKDAPIVSHDAVPNVDAPGPGVDAFVFLDASPDAASAFFCSGNNECTNAGQCCIRFGQPTGICGDGIPFAGDCIPQ